MSPLGTYCFNGTWTAKDLQNQMIVYSGINHWRTALMMQIAERERAEGRTVLFFTENPYAEHLTMPPVNGQTLRRFLMYRPGPAYQESDIDIIIDHLNMNRNIVFDTIGIGDLMFKHGILAAMVSGLAGAGINVRNLSIIFESAEQFYGRQYNFGVRSAIGMFKIFLDRCKIEGARVAFAAQSSRDIPKEIANNCNTPIVGRIGNHVQATNTSKDIFPSLEEHINKAHGLMRKNEKDFFIFSTSTTAAEALAASQLPDEMITQSILEQQILPLPARLHDITLECSFDPGNPELPPEYQSNEQDDFARKVIERREEMENSVSVPNEIEGCIIADSAQRDTVIANDEKIDQKSYEMIRNLKQAAINKTDPQEAIRLLRARGFSNPAVLVTAGLKVLSMRKNVLNSEIDKSMTSQILAKRIEKNSQLREAVDSALKIVSLLEQEHDLSVDLNAYTAAYYQALKFNNGVARAFNDELCNAHPSSEIGNLRNTLRELSKEKDDKRSAESQYRAITASWKRYSGKSGKKAA